jgi:hypothetical protein
LTYNLQRLQCHFGHLQKKEAFMRTIRALAGTVPLLLVAMGMSLFWAAVWCVLIVGVVAGLVMAIAFVCVVIAVFVVSALVSIVSYIPL